MSDLTNLVQNVGALLMEKGITIASAESCTGGLFAATLTEVAGISSVFDRGIVTYTNRAKMEELGVRAETLEQYNAVSHETAEEMASGLFRVCSCDICISVTGLAGPDGGCAIRPVGLAFIGVCHNGKTDVVRVFREGRSRQQLRVDLVEIMLKLVQDVILNGSIAEKEIS